MATPSRVAADDSLSLRIDRTLATSPDVVYAYWTTCDGIRRFWGPASFDVDDCAIDARVGGAFRVRIVARDGSAAPVATGTFAELVPGRRLVFAFQWEGEREPENVVTITLSPDGADTACRFEQGPFTTAKARDGHRDGWRDCFDKLDAAIARDGAR